NLRAAMAKKGVAAYIIFNTDPHNDEYIPREYHIAAALTGFTGENATVVVTQDFAGVWTDGRFYISGEMELKGTEVTLMKTEQNALGIPYANYLAEHLHKGDRVGCDGQLVTDKLFQKIKSALAPKGITVDNSVDLTSTFWTDRPKPTFSDIYILDDKYAGRSAAEKIADLRKKNGSAYQVVTRLDEVAWLLNLRAADIDFCPLFRAFVVIGEKEAVLFVNNGRINGNIKAHLDKNGVTVRDYNDIYNYLRQLPDGAPVHIDHKSANSFIVSSVNPKCKITDAPSPVQNAKAVKNETELRNIRQALITDGVAMERFFYKLEQKLAANEPLTEMSLAKMLLEERKKGNGFISESFGCISAFNGHAAMPHYAPTDESDIPVNNNGVYLVDSGGQYYEGTTDITRTIATTKDGRFSDKFALDYTLVLQGHIELATAIFPEGTTGSQLDLLARINLWKYGKDFQHGTGHGVGYCLNCHEGPHRISSVHNTVALVPGMIVTDEPGIYIENEYGIRTENIVQVVKSEYKGYNKFDVLTLCHIDTRPIVREILTQTQIDFVNDYNERVYQTLSPFLDEAEKEYLRERTKAI
ncbi:MAG: aminopeptidase P family protein, partial [Bacteroidales bacterium]|nr:aminopeptidase P family protein [Bacteroidales bacterium]